MGMRRLFASLVFLILAFTTRGQEIPDRLLMPGQQKSWSDFSSLLARELNIRFFYEPGSLPDLPVVVRSGNMLVAEALKEHFSGHGIRVTTDGYGNFFLYRDFELRAWPDSLFSGSPSRLEPGEIETSSLKEPGNGGEYLKTYQNLISETVVIGSKRSRQGGRALLRGSITNQEDGTPIPLATLKVEEQERYAITNNSGRYEFILEPGPFTLTVNCLGYTSKSFKINLLSDGELDITLTTKSILLEEAVISANRHHNVESTHMGLDNITSAAIKKLPVILGEQDVVKVALLLPGVQSIGEISSGFNVRGSPADQNIFYINGVPVYNATHLFGLFTTFNPDAVNGFDLYKSNIPVEYGGRLSSIFNIEAKKGNLHNFSARGGISPVSGRVMVEGPLKKEKGSFLASFRTTYSDWLLKQTDNVDISHSAASFYDALVNFSFRVNQKNNLGLFLYGSDDFSDIAFGVRNRYTNLGTSLKWSHNFNRYLALDLDLIKSRYAYEEENYEIRYLASHHSFNLDHNELKLGFRFNQNDRHTLLAGINMEYYGLDHGDFLPLDGESNIQPIRFQSEKALVTSIFVGDQLEISEKFSAEGGIRGTWYALLGPGTVYEYLENHPRVEGNITDSVSYGNNKAISRTNNLDLRLSVRYSILPDLSVKASYNKLHQYLFMLSNTISVSPTNKWKLSDPHLRPMAGEQVSFGIYKNLWRDKLEASVEIYHKEVKNLVEYKDGADFLTNQHPETNILQGDLKAYGAEFFLKKKTGRFSGWINYTWSRAEVKALNEKTKEMNNRGFTYPANYDRPHALNAVANINFTKRFNISANAIYSTGRPITFPTSLYFQDGIQVIAFSERNAYRMPDYFRTDISISFEGNLKKNKLAHGSWSVSLYNVTARKNPYTTIFRNEEGKIKGYEISILGTMIPSVSYNLKFGNYEN